MGIKVFLDFCQAQILVRGEVEVYFELQILVTKSIHLLQPRCIHFWRRLTSNDKLFNLSQRISRCPREVTARTKRRHGRVGCEWRQWWGGAARRRWMTGEKTPKVGRISADNIPFTLTDTRDLRRWKKNYCRGPEIVSPIFTSNHSRTNS